MLELRRLVLLREVHRLGSMAAAARALSYSHSAISQQLALLEQEAGVPVLERVGRSVRLTAAGEALVRRTECILAEMERAEAELASHDTRLHGTVTIAAFATLSRVVLPGVLATLADAHPELDVRLRNLPPEEALLALAARTVDIAIVDAYPGLPAPQVGDLHSSRLAIDPIRAYLPVGTDVGTPPAALRWALEPRGTEAAEWALHQCRSHGFEPTIVAESGDLLTALRLVEHGIAAAFLPDLVVQHATTALTPVPGMDGGDHRSIHLVVREGAEGRAAIRAVHDAIAAAVANLPPPPATVRAD